MVAYTWSDDEKVLELYFEAGRQSLPQDDERVLRLSEEIGHSQKSVHMKMANFQWFDPERIGGLDGGSRQTFELWCEHSPGVNPPRQIHRYSHCDDVLVLDLYFKAGRQPLPERDLKILKLSNVIGTSPRSVHRRMATYQWLDPERPGGLDTVTEQAMQIWDEFAHDEQGLKEAAADCRRRARQ